MEENGQRSSNSSTQCTKSNNQGNTFDNTQRTTKEEDALNLNDSNPPLGNQEQQGTSAAGERNEHKE